MRGGGDGGTSNLTSGGRVNDFTDITSLKRKTHCSYPFSLMDMMPTRSSVTLSLNLISRNILIILFGSEGKPSLSMTLLSTFMLNTVPLFSAATLNWSLNCETSVSVSMVIS